MKIECLVKMKSGSKAKIRQKNQKMGLIIFLSFSKQVNFVMKNFDTNKKEENFLNCPSESSKKKKKMETKII